MQNYINVETTRHKVVIIGRGTAGIITTTCSSAEAVAASSHHQPKGKGRPATIAKRQFLF